MVVAGRIGEDMHLHVGETRCLGGLRLRPRPEDAGDATGDASLAVVIAGWNALELPFLALVATRPSQQRIRTQLRPRNANHATGVYLPRFERRLSGLLMRVSCC